MSEENAAQVTEQQVKQALDGAWDEASTAIKFYVDYRAKYNLPFSPEMWHDDYALGFRDGIGFIHFDRLNPGMHGAFEVRQQWLLMVTQNDIDLQDRWLSIIAEGKGYVGRGQEGVQAALILESWRLKREITPGALNYISRHEVEYKEKFPNATQFNMDHWLIMSHFIMPLIMADKQVHPLLERR
jgi:hypothetical protein